LLTGAEPPAWRCGGAYLGEAANDPAAGESSPTSAQEVPFVCQNFRVPLLNLLHPASKQIRVNGGIGATFTWVTDIYFAKINMMTWSILKNNIGVKL
jgi:hypothetical protein